MNRVFCICGWDCIGSGEIVVPSVYIAINFIPYAIIIYPYLYLYY